MTRKVAKNYTNKNCNSNYYKKTEIKENHWLDIMEQQWKKNMREGLGTEEAVSYA